MGIATPLLSSFLTGMPPLIVASMMLVELPLYAVIVALLYRLTRNALLSVGAYGLTAYLLFPLLKLLPVKPLYPVTAGLVSGIPGIVVQLVVVPLLVGRFRPERIR